MNVLVIGGNGFVGSHLVDQLLLKNHKVRVFDISYEHYRKPLPNVDYRISSLDNLPNLVDALSEIDIVFHVASTSGDDAISAINNILIPTLKLFDLLIATGIQRIIYFSSGSAVYGIPLTNPVTEVHPSNPMSSYGIVKITIENYLLQFQREHKIKPLIIRSSNKYGPRQGRDLPKGVISTFLQNIKLNDPITIFGDGSSTKDYIYIKDLIDLSYELSFSNEVGIFNVGSGEGMSINQIIEQIKILTKKNIKINYKEKQIFDVDHFVLDISKTTNIVANYNFTTLEEGVSKTWEWLNAIESK